MQVSVDGNKQYRIRRLTPRETWRLMNFTDEQFDKAKSAGLSNSQLYKQAGHEVRTIIFRYVFGYYNTIRVTSFNPEGLPPVAYREMYLSMGIAA